MYAELRVLLLIKIMAVELDLDPQLKAFLEKSNMLASAADDSDIPIEQLREGFEKSYRWGCMHACCNVAELFCTT